MNGVLEYFDLQATEVVYGGSSTITVRQLSLYVGALLGSLSKVVYDAITANGTPQLYGFIAASIASIVVFPTLYRRARLNSGKLTPLKYFVAFQHGFFWSVLMDGLVKQMTAGSGS